MKAVRDKIPKIMKDSGKKGNFIRLSDVEFLKELEIKLDEELEEYKKSKSVEELADLVEVIYRIAYLRNTTKKEFDKIRINKKKQKGGFSKNLLLSNYEF